MAKAMFITFEGIEGCGKSTQVRLLTQALRKRKQRVMMLREPGGTVISEQIRKILLDKKNVRMRARTELLLYCAARAQIVEEKIKPALARGITVICDRYIDSTLAYQAVALKMDVAFVRRLCVFATGGLMPQLTFLPDVSVAVGLKRAGRSDRMELRSRKYHARVREAFLDFAKKEPRRFRVLDGTQSIKLLHDEILKLLQKRMP